MCRSDTVNTHNIPIYVVCYICRNLRAFWGDQTDPKSACGGPNSILRTGGVGCQDNSFVIYDRLPLSYLWVRQGFFLGACGYLVVLSQYKAVLVGNWWYWASIIILSFIVGTGSLVSVAPLCLYMLKQVKIWSGVTNPSQLWNIELFSLWKVGMELRTQL